ncbi:MAG: putative monovalent cation/H+ antiporter subunit A [Anaerolineales bacterium]|nr:putative monovalent cation/H+ antiporter subunit A [Anaerolineales bacterium]
MALLAPGLTRRLGRAAGWVFAILPVTLTLLFAGAWSAAADGAPITTTLAWVPELGLSLSFRADGLSLLFALLITGIGALVVLYGGSYLHGDRDLGRFYSWLFVFMAAMLGVALADNLLLLFVFWELTSLSSYMLIGFGHDRAPARQAALQALLITGGGGLALLAGLVLLGVGAGTFEISALLGQGAAARIDPLYVPAVGLILVGAFTKSAQFPFHFWLPNAMEAPTPISAYLHSATMVKAGVYLLLRLSPALGGTELWTLVVGGVGATTMVLGAVLALAQTDLKRLLAYSTVSALGLLTLLIGIGTPRALEAAVVFLLAHALYKGALFLVAGILDHETGTRDITRLGGLWRGLPITAAAAGGAALSMAGLPPLFGFISKELAYEAALAGPGGPALIAVVVIAGIGFVVVAAQVGLAPFWGRRPTDEGVAHAHEPGVSLWLGPMILSLASLGAGVFAGAVGGWVGPAVASATGTPVTVRLALWHGLNPALWLSLLTLAVGGLLFAARRPIRNGLSRLNPVLGADLGFQAGLGGLNAVAQAQTRFFQNGYLRFYLLMVVATTILLVGGTLVSQIGVGWPLDVLDVQAHEVVFGGLILVAALVAITSRSRLSAIAALGAAGFGVSLIYLWYGAPDLAMTQFLIESLTVILFVLVFYHLPHFTRLSSPGARARDIVIALLAGGLMTALVLTVLAVPLFPSISGYYGAVSAAEAHGRNVVNVILVDFRGLDTLGEITVLGIAATGVYALLKLHPRNPAVGPVYDSARSEDGS